MKTTTIECNNCKRDLTEAESHPEYMLVLNAQRVPDDGHTPFDLLAIKPLDDEHHFCDMDCLISWSSKTKLYAA